MRAIIAGSLVLIGACAGQPAARKPDQAHVMVICDWEPETGSNIPKERCRSQEQADMERIGAQNFLDRPRGNLLPNK